MAEIIDIQILREMKEREKMTRLEFEARKIYLENYTSIIRQVEETAMELERVIQALYPGASVADGLPRGTRRSDPGDRIASAVVSVEKMRRGVQREYDALTKRRDEIGRVLESVPEGKLREVLRLRYVLEMEWEDIAGKIHYSRRQAINIHNKAIRAMQPPKRDIDRIKRDLLEEHGEWANEIMKAV